VKCFYIPHTIFRFLLPHPVASYRADRDVTKYLRAFLHVLEVNFRRLFRVNVKNSAISHRFSPISFHSRRTNFLNGGRRDLVPVPAVDRTPTRSASLHRVLPIPRPRNFDSSLTRIRTRQTQLFTSKHTTREYLAKSHRNFSRGAFLSRTFCFSYEDLFSPWITLR